MCRGVRDFEAAEIKIAEQKEQKKVNAQLVRLQEEKVNSLPST